MDCPLANFPEFKVVRDGKKWGVKVRWPRSGPFARKMLFPRFVWYGPYGDKDARWATEDAATRFMSKLDMQIFEILRQQKA
jgi:hypothetical protein